MDDDLISEHCIHIKLSAEDPGIIMHIVYLYIRRCFIHICMPEIEVKENLCIRSRSFNY